MPWLTIVVMLLSYLMQPRGTADERRKALMGSVLTGGATYALTHYTDWGQENLGKFDGVITSGETPVANPQAPTGVPVTLGVGGTSTGGQSQTSGFWDTLKSWGPTGTAAVVGVGAAVAGSNNWLLYAGIAFAALYVLK